MKTQKYQCYICKTIFSSACYNWYSYYGEKKFHRCPGCESKLVETYDFEYLGLLDKITIRLFIISAIAWMAVSFFWGQTAGIIAFGVPALVGAITHVMYRSVISDIVEKEKEIRETRAFVN